MADKSNDAIDKLAGYQRPGFFLEEELAEYGRYSNTSKSHEIIEDD